MYKYNVVYSKDWWLFKNLDWWGGKWFWSHKFCEYLKPIRKEQNGSKIAKSLYIFLTTPDEMKKYLK